MEFLSDLPLGAAQSVLESVDAFAPCALGGVSLAQTKRTNEQASRRGADASVGCCPLPSSSERPTSAAAAALVMLTSRKPSGRTPNLSHGFARATRR
jgi:hypothetical protein